MRTHTIANRLYHDIWENFAKRVFPPWIEGCQEEEAKIKEVFDNAKEVIRQRDALIELRPERAVEYRQQCEDVILGLAQDIQELISIDVI